MAPKRRYEAAASKAARALQRRTIGSLRGQRISTTTLRRYIAAVLQFCCYLFSRGSLPAHDLRALDEQLSVFIEDMWQEGETKALVGSTLSGIQHLLRTKRCFPQAWDLYSVWQRMELPRRAPPLLAPVLMGMCGYLYSIGEEGAAAGILLGFHCLLRTDEAMSATSTTISLGPHHVGAIALPITKIGRRRGAQEICTIDDPSIGQLVQRALRRRRPGERLIDCGIERFRRLFHEAALACECHTLGLQPYSMRRGGATFDFLAHGDVLRTVQRGRWADLKTAKIYVTDGAAVMAQLRLSALQVARCAHFSDVLQRVLAG